MKADALRKLVRSLTLGGCVALGSLSGFGSAGSAQELQWATRIPGTGSASVGIATTPRGESYVTGSFQDTAVFGEEESNETELTSAGSGDIFIAKYDREGSLVWARRAGGTEVDVVEGIAATPRGEIYVTGFFAGTSIFGEGEPNATELTSASAELGDIFVAKYDREGSLLWARRAGGTQADVAHAIATTPRGESYVTGFFNGKAIFGENEPNETELTAAGFGTISSGDDMFIAKYDRDGTLLWARRAGGVGAERGQSIATTLRGESYVTGRLQGPRAIFGQGEANETELSPRLRDIFIAKYNRDGLLLWAKRAGGLEEDEGLGVAATLHGESYVTGYFTGSAIFGPDEPQETVLTAAGGRFDDDVFVAKYDRDGALLWARQAGSIDTDSGQGIATTPRGEAYVTGRFSDTAIFGKGELNETELIAAGGGSGIFSSDIFIAKYNREGSLLWATRAGGSSIDAGEAVATTSRGEIFVAGRFPETAIFGAGEEEIRLTAVNGDNVFAAKFR